MFACKSAHDGINHMQYCNFESNFYLPNPCRNCNIPICKDVCPVDAIEKTGNGTIKLNKSKCIACGSCHIACPFGSVVENDKLVYSICDLCYDTIYQNNPACIATCPTNALKTKRLKIKESEKKL
ncbi:MAG: 4Fe-4S dicluster domain-containing protein [Candidatus Zixiibacteriota bacterium]